MPRTTEDVRRDIEREREQLASAVDELREAADVTSKLRAKLPALAAGGCGDRVRARRWPRRNDAPARPPWARGGNEGAGGPLQACRPRLTPRATPRSDAFRPARTA